MLGLRDSINVLEARLPGKLRLWVDFVAKLDPMTDRWYD